MFGFDLVYVDAFVCFLLLWCNVCAMECGIFVCLILLTFYNNKRKVIIYICWGVCPENGVFGTIKFDFFVSGLFCAVLIRVLRFAPCVYRAACCFESLNSR